MGQVYACEEAGESGIGDFGGRVRMEVLDVLGLDKPALYITLAEGEIDGEIVDIVVGHADAMRVLRACVRALEAAEDPGHSQPPARPAGEEE